MAQARAATSSLATDHRPLTTTPRSLAHWCRQFSPLVAVEEAAEPDSLLLDISGVAHLFGGEEALARTILHQLQHSAFSIRHSIVAVADTAAAAWAVAHFAPSATSPAAGLPAPLIVPPGQTPAALRGLPVAALRLPAAVVELLNQVGVRRIGQLEQLPRAELTARFGPILLDRWDEALGRRGDVRQVLETPPELTADYVCEFPLAGCAAVLAIVENLLGRLAEVLVRHGLGALRIECRLRCQGAADVPLRVGLFQPTAVTAHLLPLVAVQLERLRLPGPVTAVRVEVPLTAPPERRQQALFDEGQPRHQRPRLLAALIDRLSSRLGDRAVLRPRLVADAQPEQAYAYDPLVELAARRFRGRPAASRGPADKLPPRPLRLLPRPVPLAVVSVVPDGPPVQFPWQGQPQHIGRTWGLERIETGWWRGRLVGRDYYRVETADGRRYWLFRRLRDGQWFVHGMFE